MFILRGLHRQINGLNVSYKRDTKETYLSLEMVFNFAFSEHCDAAYTQELKFCQQHPIAKPTTQFQFSKAVVIPQLRTLTSSYLDLDKNKQEFHSSESATVLGKSGATASSMPNANDACQISDTNINKVETPPILSSETSLERLKIADKEPVLSHNKSATLFQDVNCGDATNALQVHNNAVSRQKRTGQPVLEEQALQLSEIELLDAKLTQLKLGLR
ncbi:hypothetical protein KIW84_014217 [Lathyrus oleraceus]|uniref:Uncharacterized protein n=1 Tax=Pisum sativum TaxID=3888 RepID=A0A9D5BML1_PEA|nr:hypothetical protein KIW84_014217 [Pisum sativum]